MRKFVWGILALGLAAAALDVTPAAARDYPFCIKGRDYLSAVGDCSFDTYAQCAATASGRLAYCTENPFYHYARAPQRRIHRHRRHYYR